MLKRAIVAVALVVVMLAALAAQAFANPPGPGDDQCKGPKKNPHCPSGKFFP